MRSGVATVTRSRKLQQTKDGNHLYSSTRDGSERFKNVCLEVNAAVVELPLEGRGVA